MIGVLAAAFIVAVLVAQAVVLSRLRGDAEPRRPAPAPAPLTVEREPATDPVGRLVEVLRRRRWLRRSLSMASLAIMLVAIGMIGYPFYTNLYASRVQARLDRQLTSDELRQDYINCQRVGANNPECEIEDGDSLTRIQIPDIGVDTVVVEGTSGSALRAGAGHYRSTPLPCELGNVAIAGHRTTYGRPFHDLDKLVPGSMITLQIPIGSCTYRVVNNFIVEPDNIGVIANTPTGMLTLTTCHPKGSARQRLIVQAELVDVSIERL